MTDDDREHASETADEQDDRPQEKRILEQVEDGEFPFTRSQAKAIAEITAMTVSSYHEEIEREYAESDEPGHEHEHEHVPERTDHDDDRVEQDDEPSRGRFGFESNHDGASMFH